MDMPMHMFDMWAWIIVIAAVLILAATLPWFLLTRPNRQTPSPRPVDASSTPAQQPNTETRSSLAMVEEVEKPPNKTNHLRKAMNLVRPTLTDDERRVFNEVIKAGGEILQSDLPSKSDFSKAHVSKLVKSLETMGVITRQKHKWTYWVRLSDKLISESKNA
jgi:uncharacterized membrane protein